MVLHAYFHVRALTAAFSPPSLLLLLPPSSLTLYLIWPPLAPQVSEREFEFPDDFPPTARDMVDRLLQTDPDARLGGCCCGAFTRVTE